MPINAVIFDWNGTLFDDLEELAYGSVVKIFETHSLLPPTLEQYRQEITSDFMKFYYDYGFVFNFSGNGIKRDADALNKIRNQYYFDNGNLGQIRADALMTVFELKVMNVKIGIVSAETAVSLLDRLYSSRLGDFFGKELVKPECWSGKNIALLEMCQRMGVNPVNTIYVDDTVDGNNAAKKARLIAVGFCNETGYNSGDRLTEIADYTIHNLMELPDLVASINSCGSYHKS